MAGTGTNRNSRFHDTRVTQTTAVVLLRQPMDTLFEVNDSDEKNPFLQTLKKLFPTVRLHPFKEYFVP